MIRAEEDAVEFFCTTCCREKRPDAGLLPAVERYLDPRIRDIRARSQEQGRPFVILSGKFGLLQPQDMIPWYDHPLATQEVDGLVPVVAGQLRSLGCTELRFFALPRAAEGWEPYYLVLERACATAGVALRTVSLDTN